MGVPDDVLRSAIRFSFTVERTRDEIAEAARRISKCVGRVRVQQ
jgi:cysteine sulfinate desulfinase/cysteine desulfurase-like protein